MSVKRDGFTIQELEELSGFDRRTIAYYIQEGLLPKVGRRGRGTVYPAAFKERLMFIRAVRDLQDSGALRAVTLAEIKELMVTMDTEVFLRLQDATDTDETIRALFQDPDWDTSGIAVPVEVVVGERSETRSGTAASRAFARIANGPPKPPNSSPAQLQRDIFAGSIRELIDQIEAAATLAATKGNASETAVTQLSTAKLTAHISISVEGLADDHVYLLEQLVERLR